MRKFRSRFETPRVKISREAFENSGIEIFSSEKIPFADRTGPTIAGELISLLTARINKLDYKKRIHVYELGAGTGMLAIRILDLLKNRHKDIYRRTIFHVSDVSKPAIAQLRILPVFKKHRGHVFFEVINAIDPKFTYKPLLVYFTNLIDSLPHRQIMVKDREIFEFQVQTSLKKDAQIIDTTSYPPRLLEGKQIVNLLASDNIDRRLTLAPQILTILEEKSKFVPIAKVPDISKEEREDLKNLAASQNKDKPLTFNYSFPVRTAIGNIFRQLENGGFMFFSDFGFTSGQYEKAQHMECGLLIFFSVDFLSLKQAAKTAGAAYYLTSNPPGYPQEMLIDTLLRDKHMPKLFSKKSVGGLQEQVNAFIQKARTLLLQSPEEITRLYNSLSRETQNDYLLLTNLSFLLLQTGFYKEAEHYADILFRKYGYSVGIYYYLVKGKVEQEWGNLKTAEKFFKKAIGDKKGFLAYAYLGELYWQEKRYKEYIKTLKEYLKYTRRGDHLKSMLSIALAQEKLSDKKSAQKTLEIIIDIGQKLKKISQAEKEILFQAEKQLTVV